MKNKIPLIFEYNDNHNYEGYLSYMIKVGSKKDEYLSGISHFLEHFLIESIVPYYNLSYYSLRGLTSLESTSFTIKVKNDNDIGEGLNLLEDIANGSFLNEVNVEKVRQDIINEYNRNFSKIHQSQINKYLYKDLGFSSNLPIGKLEDINCICFDHLKSHFKNYNKKNLPMIVYVGNQFNSIALYGFKKNYNFSHLTFPPKKNWGTEISTIYAIREHETQIDIYMPCIQPNKILDDFIITIFDNVLERVWKDAYPNIKVECSTNFFDSINMFIVLKVKNINPKIFMEELTLNRKCFLNKLFNFLFSCNLSLIIKQYISFLIKNPPTNKMVMENLIVCYSNEIPIYSVQQYIDTIQNIDLNTIIDKIKMLLSQEIYFWG